MYQLKLGSSISFADAEYYKKLNEMKSLEFYSVDFDFSNVDAWNMRLEDGLDAIQKVGLHLNAVHLPFGWHWELCRLDDEEQAEILRKLVAYIKRIDPYKPDYYILHGSTEPVTPETREERKAQLKKSVGFLRENTDTVLCLEDLPRTCLLNTAEETIQVVDAIDGVRICADVNHFLQEKSEDAVLKMGKRIATTHISDHDYIDEKHWLPKEGKIDWMKLISSFESVGYNGVFSYEALKYSPEQIRKNYDELFAEYNALKK